MSQPQAYEPWPLDIKLLEMLPDAGLIGGVHHKGKKVKSLTEDLNKEIGENIVTSNQVQTRCRVMRIEGLVGRFPASGGHIWARTEKGREFLLKEKGEGEKVDGN